MLLIRPATIDDTSLVSSNATESVSLFSSSSIYALNDKVRVSTGSLDLNFGTGVYQANGSAYALGSIPGYSYTRSGAEAVNDSDNTIDSFLANAPPINGYGYHAYGALTNSLLQSQTFDNASWTKAGSTVSANAATAPDGTATADKIVSDTSGGANHQAFQLVVKAAAIEQWTGVIFVKAAGWNFASLRIDDGSASGVQLFVDLTTGLIVGTPSASGFSWTATPVVTDFGSGWYRITARVTTTANASIRCIAYTTNSGSGTAVTGDGTSGMFAWQAQLIKGDLPDGGPNLVTTSAAATIGAPVFSVTMPNGTYTLTYTFDDSSTQVIPTTVSGGSFTLDTYPNVLNRPRIKRAQLTTAAVSSSHRIYQSVSGGTSAVVTMTIASPAVVTWTAHGLAANTPILFTTTGAFPTGLVAGTIYYVLAPTTNTFNVSATAGGAAINTSGTQSGTHTATANPNKGFDPVVDDGSHWIDIGPTNKWAMFDSYNGTATTDASSIDVTVAPTSRVDSLALLNLANAVSVRVVVSTVADGTVYDQTTALTSTEGISDLYSYFFEEIVRKTNFLATDLPTYSNPIVRVLLTGTGTAIVGCGTMVLGMAKDLGRTLYDGAQIGIIDYSRKDVDAFGNYTIIQRAFSKRGTFKMRIAKAQVDGVHSTLSDYRATPAVYSATTDYDSTLIFGFFRSFGVEIDYPLESLVSIEIEGLT